MIRNLRANLVFLTLLALMLVSSANTVNATVPPSPEPKTVADFFLLVPERYVGYPLDFRQQLLRGERRGTVIDIPNGYISWDASDNPEGSISSLLAPRATQACTRPDFSC